MMAEPLKPPGLARRRPLHLRDLMAMVAAAALTLISPAIMKAIIPARSYDRWDRRQYVAHLAALVMIWWTVTLVPLAFAGARPGLRRILRSYGCAAILASATALLFIIARQVPVVILRAAGVGHQQYGILQSRVFDLVEHAPDAVGASVVAAWTILALTRTGRRPSTWIEWLGCVMGLTWMVLGILALLVWVIPIPWLTRSGIPW
jgi:hypothetical protein